MEYISILLAFSVISSSQSVFAKNEETKMNCTITSTSEGFISVNCGSRHLKKVPRWLPPETRGLDLSDNDIEQLPYGSFSHLWNLVWLRINKCQLRAIEADAFLGLGNLKSLEIHSNILQADNISDNAFKSLVLLESFDISDNLFYLDKKFPEGLFVYLNNLQTLTIDIFGDALYGSGFQNLFKLTTLNLMALSNQDLILRNDTLNGLSKVPLQYLLVSLYAYHAILKDIEFCTFCPLKFLKGINIIGNEFVHLPQLMRSLYGLRDRTMEYIIINDVNRHIGAKAVSLTTTDTQYLASICVKKLSLANDFVLLDSNLRDSLLSFRHKECIQEIDVSYSIFLYDFSPIMILLTSFKNLRILQLCCMKRLHIENIRITTTSRIPLTYDVGEQPYITDYLKNFSLTKNENINIYLSPNIEFINSSYMETRSTTLPSFTINGGKLQTLDFFNAAFTTCTGEVKGVGTVLSLNMSGWNCQDLNKRILHNFTSLQHLEIKNSNLGEGLKSDRTGELFKHLKHLSVLKLSMNGLVLLHPDLFSDQYLSMKTLYLDGNKFTNVPIDVTEFSQLEYIDISNNVINYIEKTQRDQMDNLYSKTHKLGINLDGNMLVCSCETLDFLTWLTKTRVTVSGINNTLCVDAKGRSSNISDVIQNLDVYTTSCISKFWLIISIIGTSILLVVLVLSSIGYRYRYFIEYTCLRVRMFLRRHKAPDEDGYQYDAFVAYSSLDTEWVTTDLYRRLKPDFNICLYDKDFVPGVSISDNIINAIDSSRKVIFVVTRNLLESSWGNYEMEMTRIHAFQKGRDNMIIIIIKDNLTIAEMPRVLQSIWWKIVCLVWNDNPADEALELFWSKLKNAVSE